MTKRKIDRRVKRTKEALAEALIALIAENGYEKVRVQHIVERANVGRTTFYAHFDDKDSLLQFALSGLEQFVDISADFESSFQNLLVHATENRRMFRVFIETQPLREQFNGWLIGTLQSQWPSVEPGTIQFVAGGITALIRWWQTQRADLSIDDIMRTIRSQLTLLEATKS